MSPTRHFGASGGAHGVKELRYQSGCRCRWNNAPLNWAIDLDSASDDASRDNPPDTVETTIGETAFYIFTEPQACLRPLHQTVV